MSKLYSQSLLNDYKKFKEAKEKLKESLFKELLDVLRKSQYYHVEIDDGNVFSYDENNYDIEDNEFDNIISSIVFDYNNLDKFDQLSCVLYRNKDF